MATVYRIFKNDGHGGPVDYSTVVATVSAPPWAGAALAVSSDTTFAVRAYDNVLALDDMNRDVVARVVLDASGVDITATPAPPFALAARPTGTTSLLVEFAHHLAMRPKPTGFRIWATAGGSVNYAASPNLTVPWPPGRTILKHLAATLTGLTAATAYSVGVRAYNAAGAEANTISATATTAASAPLSVVGLVATPATVPGPSGRAIAGTAP